MEHTITNYNEFKLNDVTDDILRVKHWMTPNPYYIKSQKTYLEAAQMLLQLRLDCLPIVDDEHQPIAIVTMRKLLKTFIQNDMNKRIQTNIHQRHFVTVKENDNLFDIIPLPYENFPVVNEHLKLIGVLTRRDLLDGIVNYTKKLEHMGNTAEILNGVLDSAYEGVAVVDENGILREFNEAYSRFTGIKREDAIGKHVTEVIDNTNLHITVKTGIPERGVLQTIQGQGMVVHRIPIWKDEKVVGAIGMLIFEGVTEVYNIYERMQKEHLKEQKIKKPTIEDSGNKVTIAHIIGDSESISHVKRLTRRAARTSATVLITGESGTGKEVFAKSIHHLSSFSNGPFISLNCAAIPDHLIESELFGYVEGAFTGARKGGKPGKLELANNGTLFLDEIGEMPLLMQAKLLRAIQEREGERVGGLKKYHVNVRIVSATNRNLEEMVQNGTFREDLYYRLNIIRLHLPPLRERTGDIPILLSHFLKKVCRNYQIPEKVFTSEAVAALINYEWKGNIREVINTIERLVTLVEGNQIDYKHLPLAIQSPAITSSSIQGSFDYSQVKPLEKAKQLGVEKEKEMILKALNDSHGNKSQAAKLMGIHRTTLYQKLRKYNIQ